MPEVRLEHRQRGHRVRLEWGPAGVDLLAGECAAVIIVDVLSFCTSVDIAVGRGAEVVPQRSGDRAAAARDAAARGALPAGPRSRPGPSLRPSSLLELAAGTRLALPSPNGGTLCAAAADRGVVVFAGCLRNASAVAAAALAVGIRPPVDANPAGSGAIESRVVEGAAIGLVPAGERWPDGTLRVAAEDLIGAGAIAAALPWADRSPEAEVAVALFSAARDRGLPAVLAALSSGRELVADGFGPDVELAAAYDTSPLAPRLRDGLLTGH